MKKEKEITPLSESCTKFLTYIDTHFRGIVALTDDVSYTMQDVIKQNTLDRNFTFSIPYYSDGTEKIFFSVPYILADATYRNTDLDTKDIQVKSDNLAAIDWIPLVRGATRNYLKTYNFDTTMNDIRKEMIDMGHVLTKEVNSETKICTLLNIVRPSDIMNLQDGGLAEAVYLTWEQIEENKDEWKDNWDKLLEMKGIADATQRKTFRLYEWWTVDTFNGKKTKGCIKFFDCRLFEADVPELPENWTPVIELERFVTPFEEKVKNKARLKKLRKLGIIAKDSNKEPLYPYEEQPLYRVPGRWMGMGYYELLRNVGKAFNRTMNEKLRYDELLHKGILVHTKSPFAGNQKGSGRGLESDIMNRIQTGTMISIKAGEKIDRLNLGSLTADFLATADKWFQIARQMVGVSEVASGDRLPSSMPATIGVLNEKQAKNAFDLVNEQQGIYFKRLFTRFKLKEIIDDITQEEWTKIIGDPEELKRMEEAFIENLVNVKVAEAAATGKFVPESSSMDPQELEKIKAAVQVMRGRQGENRFAQFKDAMLEDFDLEAEFYIVNEAFDKQMVLQSIQEAITTIAGNPMSELDADKLIEMKLDLMELNAASLRKSPERIQADREAAIAEATGMVSPANSRTVEGMGKEFGQANMQRA